MELFESASGNAYEPLASRMRPRTIDEFAGQGHILAEGRLLRRAIQLDQLSSLIFYGPPGTGKTTLARVIANTTKSIFTSLNAVLAGVKEIREIVAEAKDRRAFHDQKTILFVDEVHRWNKSQQDALLPWVENGTVIFIGATTQNPYFEVNPALVSRSRIFQLLPLTAADLTGIAESAIKDPIRGYGRFKVTIDPDALQHLIKIADGDARSVLNALELAVETTPKSFPPSPDESIHITLAVAEESIQKKALLYDRDGDYHYDTISAFIKSMRGSDPDATMYWLARMVAGGEDPKFIFRRMLIFACEDIGMADPNALVFLESAAATFERIGLPEGRFHLAHAALYCATAPKSNSVLGFFDALDLVEQEQKEEIPSHLKDGNRDREGFGHGKGYLYPHAYSDHWVAQQYLPGALKGRIFYHPGMIAFEKHIAETIMRRREAQLDAALPDAGPEILSYAVSGKGREKWLQRASGHLTEQAAEIRDRIFAMVKPARHDRILVCHAQKGLLLWEALRSTPEGAVTGIVHDAQDHEIILHYAEQLPDLLRPFLVIGDELSLDRAALDNAGAPGEYDHAAGRNVLAASRNAGQAVENILQLVSKKGTVTFADAIASESTLLSDIVSPVWKEGHHILKNAETALANNPLAPGFSLSSGKIPALFSACGAAVKESFCHYFSHTQVISKQMFERWFDTAAEAAGYGTFLKQTLSEKELFLALDKLREILMNREVAWKTAVFFIHTQKS
ncbi:MAG: AAA family ATPase [Spirochaetales bacterium]|nr:AAA family ATPase [Spirochaetales bacterium]